MGVYVVHVVHVEKRVGIFKVDRPIKYDRHKRYARKTI